MNNKTKIVATIGPATQSDEKIEQLIAAGMNVARFNTKHSTPQWHSTHIKKVKKIAKKLNTPVSILLDLQGPEVRVDMPDEKPVSVAKGKFLYFTSDPKLSKKPLALVPQLVIDKLDKGDDVVLADGSCEFRVHEKGGNYLMAQALVDCQVQHRKTVNTPGKVLDMPSLTERDFTYLSGVDKTLIDFVGLSFVRSVQDIEILKDELKKRHFNAGIIPKIENQAALDNLDSIIEAADAVMIARGDLGVEVEYQELTYWQKHIINKCRLASKPVITATQMLKSMVTNPRPTRAEVSDVANSIYDGTDAVMLSEETTIGLYPVRSVSVQAKIAEFNEQHASHNLTVDYDSDLTSSITHSAINLLKHSVVAINKIVCLTQTGRTALLLSRFRPSIPITAVTHDPSTYNRLTLSYGVVPHLIELEQKETVGFKSLINQLKEQNALRIGERVLFIHGKNFLKNAITNTLSILEIT